jgi:hypothetical protein
MSSSGVVVSSRPGSAAAGVRLTLSIELPGACEAELLAAHLEGELLDVERCLPGARFLGWSTCHASHAPIGSEERVPGHDGASGAGHSQRELVLASLMRRPSGTRREAERGRGMRR